jgi:hypothetical protein
MPDDAWVTPSPRRAALHPSSLRTPHGLRPTFGYRTWELILSICRDRAVRTPSGELRVNGRRIEPDAYLRRWRKVIANAVPLCRLRQELRLQLVATFSWPVRDGAALRGKARSHTHTHVPYDTLGALLLARAQAQDLAPDAGRSDGREVVHIGLDAPNGARDAWWVGDCLRGEEGARSSIGVYRSGDSPLAPRNLLEGASA